jgi:quinol monooxygenase YgiN
LKLTIEVKSRSNKFQELFQTLQALVPIIRKDKGCRDCRVYRDLEDEEGFFIIVHWEKQVPIEHFVNSSSGRALLGAIDLLSESAKVRFGRDLPWDGIETLKKMRKAKPVLRERYSTKPAAHQEN